MLLAKSLCNTNIIGFSWDIKTSNIEYYDIQYAAERTNSLKFVGKAQELQLEKRNVQEMFTRKQLLVKKFYLLT